MDLIVGRERRVTGYGHWMLQGEIFHYVQSPQLLADALHCQALRKMERKSLMENWRQTKTKDNELGLHFGSRFNVLSGWDPPHLD